MVSGSVLNDILSWRVYVKWYTKVLIIIYGIQSITFWYF
jgi:hypothetical protein